MQICNIGLKTIKDVLIFQQIANSIPGKVTVRKDIYVVDGKSLMGLFSLDTSANISVEMPDDATELANYVSNFVI